MVYKVIGFWFLPNAHKFALLELVTTGYSGNN